MDVLNSSFLNIFSLVLLNGDVQILLLVVLHSTSPNMLDK